MCTPAVLYRLWKSHSLQGQDSITFIILAAAVRSFLKRNWLSSSFFYCECVMVRNNTVTTCTGGATALIYARVPTVFPPLPLHHHCKSQCYWKKHMKSQYYDEKSFDPTRAFQRVHGPHSENVTGGNTTSLPPWSCRPSDGRQSPSREVA